MTSLSQNYEHMQVWSASWDYVVLLITSKLRSAWILLYSVLIARTYLLFIMKIHWHTVNNILNVENCIRTLVWNNLVSKCDMFANHSRCAGCQTSPGIWIHMRKLNLIGWWVMALNVQKQPSASLSTRKALFPGQVQHIIASYGFIYVSIELQR